MLVILTLCSCEESPRTAPAAETVVMDEEKKKLIDQTLKEIKSYGNGVYFIPRVKLNPTEVPEVGKITRRELEDTDTLGAVFAKFADQNNLEIISIAGDSSIVTVFGLSFEGAFAHTTHKGYWAITRKNG